MTILKTESNLIDQNDKSQPLKDQNENNSKLGPKGLGLFYFYLFFIF